MSEANQLILTEGAAKGLLIGPARPQALWKNGRSRRGANSAIVSSRMASATPRVPVAPGIRVHVSAPAVLCCLLNGEILMLTSSKYLNSSPIHCIFCGEPFRRGDGFVEFWRTATGDHFFSEFYADDAEEALFKKRHTTTPVELPRW